MTTKAAALYSWFNSLGIPAYVSTSVPDNARMPYMTYTPYFGAFGDGEVNIPVSLWYRSESETGINRMVDKISKTIGRGGLAVPSEDGFMWLKRGAPFAYAVADEDSSVKRRDINITIEFMTSF